MGFNDALAQADGVTIALACGFCGEVAAAGHQCVKRYLRAAAVVHALPLCEDGDPSDLILIRTEQPGEEYTTTRAVFERNYTSI